MRGKQTVVGQRVRIAKESLKHFLIVRVGVGEAAIRDQRVSGAEGGAAIGSTVTLKLATSRFCSLRFARWPRSLY